MSLHDSQNGKLVLETVRVDSLWSFAGKEQRNRAVIAGRCSGSEEVFLFCVVG